MIFMERYITFVRNMKTSEEFISSRRDASGKHKDVIIAEMKKYPSPEYRIHTCYTEKELHNILETLNRWTGPVDSTSSSVPADDISFRETMS